MSVRKGDRTQGKLEVLNDIMELCTYTISTCRKDKVFPKSHRWTLAKRIIDETIEAGVCIRKANAIMVGEDPGAAKRFEIRNGLQTEAHAHLGAVYFLVDLALRLEDIDVHRAEYWTCLIYKTDEKLKAWARANKNDFLASRKR